ncbi:uncharacterized protein At4g26485 isoform X1 [Lolium perenne]|uniref:uncharacterized protein At4g26485 isoform X1 n=1 Tax=Lolium perenne TaxID=4522 RepID=UPI0021F59464|nr:heavy metal-associated isoprenylated plant protein 41-like isoform X1 [Lolium perenne]
MGRQRRSARGVQWVNHYSSAQSILVVGDGDFSFSLALAAVFGSGENLVATSLDSYAQFKPIRGYLDFIPYALTSKYGKAKSNVTQLERLGATVFHGVDAKMMKRHPCLKMRRFDRIVFNFPHAGFIGHEQDDHMIKAHQLLVRKFFRNASHLIRPDGEIHVSHKTGQPYDRWQIEELASEFSLVISEKVNFWKEDYPGYNQKRGDGEWCDEEFPLRNGYTFKFRVERGEPEEPPSRKFTTSQRESLHRLQESLDDVTKMHQEKEQQLLMSQQQLISISESLRSCVDARITLKSRLEEEQRRSRKFTMAQRETLHSLQESLDVVTKLHEEKKQQLLLFRQELISTSESLCTSEHVRNTLQSRLEEEQRCSRKFKFLFGSMIILFQKFCI